MFYIKYWFFFSEPPARPPEIT